MNERLELKEKAEAVEFDLMERLISEHSQLNLTDVVTDIMNVPISKETPTAKNYLENVPEIVKTNDNYYAEEPSFDPQKYDDADSFFDQDVAQPDQIETHWASEPKLIRKTAKIRSEQHNFDSLPSSISVESNECEIEPLNAGFNRDMNFSDVSPWEDTLKDSFSFLQD